MGLVWTPEHKINGWAKVLSAALVKSGALYAIADTETTSTQLICERTGVLNRVVEMAFLFYTKGDNGVSLVPVMDSDGEHIIFHEPVNFFMESGATKKKFNVIERIPNDSIEIHGITEAFLLAEKVSPKGGRMLKEAACEFGSMIKLLLELLVPDAAKQTTLPVYMVYHNARFDLMYLNSEMNVCGLPPLESYALTIDTLEEAKLLFTKKEIGNFTLDSLYEYGLANYFGESSRIERPFHDARTDSEILKVGLETIWMKKQSMK
jgi:DNA polymerase III epsilon subunit-like protein